MQIAARWITRILGLIAFLIVARIGYALVVDYLASYDCNERGGRYFGGQCDGAEVRRD